MAYPEENMTASTPNQIHGEAFLTHLLFISRQMAEMRSLKPLRAFTLDEVLHFVGAELGYIVLLQEDGGLDYRVKRHIDGQDVASEMDPIGHSILKEVIHTRKSVAVRNALTDPRFSNVMSVRASQFRSIMCVPMLTKDRVIGVMYVEIRSKTSRFTEEDLIPLEFFSAQAAVAIDNANLNDRNLHLFEAAQQELAERQRLEEKDKRRQAWLAKVVEAGKAIVLVTDLRMCLLLVREITLNSLGFDRVGFWLYDAEKEEIRGTFGVDREGNFREEFDQCIAFTSGDPRHGILSSPNGFAFEPNVSERYNLTNNPDMRGVKEHVGLSVWASGQLIGIMYCDNVLTERPMTEEQLEALKHWGGYVGLAVRNAQLLDSVRHLNATLEQRVAERTAELHTAQQHILTQEKLASLGVLTAGVAHELRNPLNFVKNYTEASLELSQELLEALPKPDSVLSTDHHALMHVNITDLIQNMERMRQHSNRAEKVIQNMTQHVHAEIQQAVPQATNLNELVEQAVKLAYHSQHTQDASFNFAIHADYAPDLPEVDLVAANFNQAIINLVENACDAMRRKQENMGVEAKANYKPTLFIKTQTKNEFAEITIEDNGSGIPPEAKSRILDPFFTTKPVGQGIGLGLYITHDVIVNQHHGLLAFESQENHFTQVNIRIPIRQHIPSK